MKKITIKGFQRKLQIPSEFESGSIIFSSVDIFFFVDDAEEIST